MALGKKSRFATHILLILLPSNTCGFSHVGIGEQVQLSADVKSNILKALELNPKDSASLHILGIWHFSVANLGFLSRSFVKVIEAHLLESLYSLEIQCLILMM